MEQGGNHLSLHREMISVVVPAYNEARRIGEVLNRIRIFADEMLVVNDGSTDGTPEVAEKAGAKVVNNREKKGYIGCIRTGFHEATGDIIVTIDADGEHNPDEIPPAPSAHHRWKGRHGDRETPEYSKDFRKVNKLANFYENGSNRLRERFPGNEEGIGVEVEFSG
jgi:glycosyltransferase involved in cell wall biosynthesis